MTNRAFPARALTLAMVATATLAAAPHATADTKHAQQQNGAVMSPADSAKTASFDILAAHVHRDGRLVRFHMTAAGAAGAVTPPPAGALAAAPVLSYVWPVTLDPASVGFEPGSGILALAATSHPDFDDTPLFDENGDGDRGNDGVIWHSHWVVLAPTEACGAGALAVRDIKAGETPLMPATWPGLPIYLVSPGVAPRFDGPEITLDMSFASDIALSGVGYDGVTAALRVNADLHAPLLCVTDVFDVASGDLSLPGRID